LLSSSDLILETKEVWESAVTVWGRVLCTVSQAYRRNAAAEFDELQCKRICVADTFLRLIRIIVRTLKEKVFPQLHLLLFVEVLQADCQLAV
jgi:hypothetical protein